MTLENIFHFLGIIYMLLGIFFLLALIIIGIMIKKKIDQLTDTVNEKLAIISKIKDDPGSILQSVGTKVANAAWEKVKKATKTDDK